MLQELEQPYGYDVSVNDAFRPLSKFFDRVWRPEQLPAALLGAMRVLTDPAETGAVTHRPAAGRAGRGVRLARGAVRQAGVARRPPGARARRVGSAPPRSSAARERPLVVAGGGVHYSEATEALRAFAEATGIPVADTQAGKGALLWDHPQAVGGVGSTGSPVANALAREADVVIGVGTRYSDFTTASRTAFQHPGVRFVNLNVAAARRGQARGRDARGRRPRGPRRARAPPSTATAPHRDRGTPPTGTASSTRRSTSATSRCPAQTEVLGALNEAMDARDVVVQAAGLHAR